MCFLMFIPLIVNAQGENKGIKFEQGLSWENVRIKAKEENKYIFMDCYATWCGPCKTMDRDVYPNDSVGNFINNKFISVKVQMDTNKNDNDMVKSSYADAHAILLEYKINAFPTFLFFSPDGKLVHRYEGGKDSGQFIELADDALNPKKQYYRLLADYQKGKKDTSVMKQLARSARQFDGQELAEQIALDYINCLNNNSQLITANIQFLREFNQNLKVKQIVDNYINNLSKKKLYNKGNLELMRDFMKNSKDKGFSIFYNHAAKINKIMGGNKYAKSYVVYIITKEEIDPILVPAIRLNSAMPDWDIITKSITKKYNKNYACRAVVGAKIRWYGYKQDWQEYTKNLIAGIVKAEDMDNCYYINGIAWEVFQHSNDKGELRTCIQWMKHVVKLEPLSGYYLDTYANLLYKAGSISDAIHLEEKVLEIATESKDEFLMKWCPKVLLKMKEGQPTWKISKSEVMQN